MKKKKILIVDDMEVNRVILSKMFREEYEILQAENGLEAIDIISKEAKDIQVILLDIIMPKMDGFGVLSYLNDHDYIKEIPVIFITGDTSTDSQKKGYDFGVSDIIVKPFDVNIVRKRVHNLVELYVHKNRLEEIVEDQTLKIKEQNRKIQEMNFHIIDTLGTIVEFRNLESGNHILRVREFTTILATEVEKCFPEYGLTDESVAIISYAAAMHDVGKIAIPDNILLKPGRLTKEEFEVMKSHSERGGDIIERITAVADPEYLKYCYEIARHHHEKYDGKGYPDGLKGDNIPIAAQIVSIADVYDALVSDRIYKSAYSDEEAFSMILKGECGVFNPKLLKCFVATKDQFARKAAELK